MLDENFHPLYITPQNEVTHYRIADNGKLLDENGYVVATDSDGAPIFYLAGEDGNLLRPTDFAIVDETGTLLGGIGTPQTALITAREAISGALILSEAAAATPRLGTSAVDATSRIIDAEDLTIYGPVGTANIDVKNAMTAEEIAYAVNAQHTFSGVRATAKTEMQLSFNKLAGDALIDSVSFRLYGRDNERVDINATINFGGLGGDTILPHDADLTQLHAAINEKSGITGINATLSLDKQNITLTALAGYDIVIEDYQLATSNMGLTTPKMQLTALDTEDNPIGEMVTLSDAQTDDTLDSARISGQISFHAAKIFSIKTASDGDSEGGLFLSIPGAATLTSVAQMDVLTLENAQAMLNVVDGALTRVDAERGNLGASMNRMQYTINNLSNIVLNTKASRSRIRDADIASETAELTRAQVLQQAAQAMLAQANRASQSVLTLLQG